MPRPMEIRDTNNEWQSILRYWMDSKNITIDSAAELSKMSVPSVKRLLALPGKGTTYGRKRWKAGLLNYFMASIGIPANLVQRVNLLAAREEGWKL